MNSWWTRCSTARGSSTKFSLVGPAKVEAHKYYIQLNYKHFTSHIFIFSKSNAGKLSLLNFIQLKSNFLGRASTILIQKKIWIKQILQNQIWQKHMFTMSISQTSYYIWKPHCYNLVASKCVFLFCFILIFYVVIRFPIYLFG